MGPELRAADLYLYYRPPRGLNLQFYIYCNFSTHYVNYAGATSDEQDEFTMSLWSCHSKAPHGELVCTLEKDILMCCKGICS